MNNNDLAICYNTNILKINKALAKMQKIGLDVSKYEEALEEIDASLKENINSSYHFNAVDTLMQDVLEQSYVKANNKVELLYSELNKYEIYLQVASFCGVLKSFILSNSNSSSEVLNLGIVLRKMLDGIKKSNTLDYEVEGKLVEDIYHLAYEFIKIELKVLGSSLTLDFISSDCVHKINLDHEITHALENIDLKDKRYQSVVKRIGELDSLGLDSTYVDLELLNNLVNAEKYQDFKKIVPEISEKLAQYYQNLSSLNEAIQSKKNKINSKQEASEEIITSETVKNIFKSLATLGVTVGIAVGIIKLSKPATTEKKYHTITTSSLEDTIQDYYLAPENLIDSSNIGTFLYEYSPYEKNRFGNFERTMTAYDLSDFETLSLEEYLELDFKALGIKKSSSPEIKKSLNLADTYEEAYYILQDVDKDDIISTENRTNQIIFSVLYIVVEALILFVINLKSDGALTDSFEDILNDLKNLKEAKTDIKQTKAELLKLHQKFYTLVKENEELIKEATNMIPFLDDKEISKLEHSLTKVRKLIKNNNSL